MSNNRDVLTLATGTAPAQSTRTTTIGGPMRRAKGKMNSRELVWPFRF